MSSRAPRKIARAPSRRWEPDTHEQRNCTYGTQGLSPGRGTAPPRRPQHHAGLLDVSDERLPHLRHPLRHLRSEEHTSELQSLLRISYAVFCLKKKTTITHQST